MFKELITNTPKDNNITMTYPIIPISLIAPIIFPFKAVVAIAAPNNINHVELRKLPIYV